MELIKRFLKTWANVSLSLLKTEVVNYGLIDAGWGCNLHRRGFFGIIYKISDFMISFFDENSFYKEVIFCCKISMLLYCLLLFQNHLK